MQPVLDTAMERLQPRGQHLMTTTDGGDLSEVHAVIELMTSVSPEGVA
ncbi:MAG: hypothetical protein ACRDS1_06735 [Pseudonocardiaceae bacterium]